MSKPLDVICLGRAAVDLYGEQIGSRLEDVQTFAKYLGGSSANLAAGLGRLGVKSSMLTRVGDEHMGRFVREALAREGVDVSHVRVDPERLTGLVLLAVENRDSFPLIFYREDCADMALSAADVDEAYITSARMLAITGTHLSTEGTRAACRQAIRFAKAHDTRVVLDVDYRPVLWNLAGRGRGDERYVESAEVSAVLREFLPDCDLLVGTEQEICIAGGHADRETSLDRIRALTRATVVMKTGASGCVILERDAGGSRRIDVPGVDVEVLNVLGAGDAFLSGYLYGWLKGENAARCGVLGNACGGLVVSRHGCTPAMPTEPELEDYLLRASNIRRPDLDERIDYLHRATTRDAPWPELFVLAFDHRSQFEQLADSHGADRVCIGRFKSLIVDAVERVAGERGLADRMGVLIDGRYGGEALQRVAGRGWWIGRPVEVPLSRPLEFEAGSDVGAHIRRWPSAQVVKCLVHYHPDDPPDLRLAQERRLVDLFRGCVAAGRLLILEVITSSVCRVVDDDTVARTLRRCYNLGVCPDWWKLEAQTAEAWARISAVVEERDPHCAGVLLLGREAPEEELREAFSVARRYPACKGFAIGRSIFQRAATRWMAGEIDDASATADIAGSYARIIDHWRRAA